MTRALLVVVIGCMSACTCSDSHPRNDVDVDATGVDAADAQIAIDAGRDANTHVDSQAPDLDAGGEPDATVDAGTDAAIEGCADGYVRVADDDCAPILITLELSTGTLDPALSPQITEHSVHVVVATELFVLTPTTIEGATITINSASVSSGASWQTYLEPGTNHVEIIVSAAEHPNRRYALDVIRSGSIRTTRDDECDGVNDRCSVTTYGANGHDQHTEFDHDCDGVIDACSSTITVDRVERSSWYDDCDGQVDQGGISTYDERGNQLTAVRITYGSSDNCIAYEYDDRGRMTAYLQDQNCNGAPDVYCNRYTYDPQDGTRHYIKDDGCDGVVDHAGCSIETRDAAGRLVYAADNDDCDDGGLDACVTQTWSETGVLTSIAVDEDCNGFAEERDLHWEYDARSRTTYTAGCYGCDSTPMACTFTAYAPDGSSSQRSDSNCDHVPDGAPANCTSYTFQ